MADGILRYQIEFDPDTGKLQMLEGEMTSLGKKGESAMGGMGESIRRVGEIVAGIGIESMFSELISGALESTGVIERTNNVLKIGAASIVEYLHQVGKSLDEQADEANRWSVKHGTATQKQIDDEKAYVDAHRDALAIDVEIQRTHDALIAANMETASMTKLAEIRDGEEKAVDLLKRTGDMKALARKTDEESEELYGQKIAALRLEYAQMIRRIELKAQAEQVADLQATHATIESEMTAALERSRADNQEELDAVGVTASRRRDLIAEGARLERVNADAQFADQMAMLQEQEKIEPEKLAQIERLKEAVRSKHRIEMVKIADAERKDLDKIDNDYEKSIIESWRKIAAAGMEHFATRLAQTHNFRQSAKAAGDAMVIDAGKQASEWIQTQIPAIAIAAYRWGNSVGGPIAGAAAAVVAVAGAEAIAAGAAVGARAAVGPGDGGIDENQPTAGTAIPGGGTSSGVSAGGAPGSGGTTILGGGGAQQINVYVAGGDYYEIRRLGAGIGEEVARRNAEMGIPVVTASG